MCFAIIDGIRLIEGNAASDHIFGIHANQRKEPIMQNEIQHRYLRGK